MHMQSGRCCHHHLCFALVYVNCNHNLQRAVDELYSHNHQPTGADCSCIPVIHAVTAGATGDKQRVGTDAASRRPFSLGHNTRSMPAAMDLGLKRWRSKQLCGCRVQLVRRCLSL